MGLLSRLNAWLESRRVSQVVHSDAYRDAFNRNLNARYDAAQTTTDNERHWANSDGLGPNAANSSSVRQKVRRRARYEALENNSYAKGMVLSFANQLIGTGPRLQLATRDKAANQRVERSFQRWAEEINFAEKLRTMAMAYLVDGETFALFTTNDRLSHSVKLDLVPVECDYFEPGYTYDAEYADGAEYDESNNPIRWFKWDEHPGELTSLSLAYKPTAVDADQVIHVHRPDRPGQRRGISHLVTALPLFAMYRRFKIATLAAAETAADFAAVLYTTGAGSAETPGDGSNWGATIPIEHRAMMTLPDGWEMKQFSPEHPQTTMEMFENRIISEVARCLLQPLNIAIGSSKDHNFSSGKLDHLGWDKAILVERSRWVCRAVQRVVRAWLDEAMLVDGLLPIGVGPMAEWDIGYRWDASGVIDEEKQSKADGNNLANGTVTRTDIYARNGKDIDVEDAVGATENGITVEEYRRGIWQARNGGGSSAETSERNQTAEAQAEAVA
jgi:capsid protein